MAPRIAFLALDDPGMDLDSMVTLHYCNTGSKKVR